MIDVLYTKVLPILHNENARQVKLIYQSLTISNEKSESFPQTGSFGQFVSMNQIKIQIHQFM